jgi:hypothetical protein
MADDLNRREIVDGELFVMPVTYCSRLRVESALVASALLHEGFELGYRLEVLRAAGRPLDKREPSSDLILLLSDLYPYRAVDTACVHCAREHHRSIIAATFGL